MARRRYQKGSIILNGNQWSGRFLEDVRMQDGSIRRVHRKVYLGDKTELPTAKLARRKLEPFLAKVNSQSYRPQTVITLREFVTRWEPVAKPQYGFGTWSNHQVSLRRYLLPRFGDSQLADINTEQLQVFFSQLTLEPSSVRNVIKTLKAVWESAMAWSYVQHNPFLMLKKPRLHKKESKHFTESQVQLILDHAEEPYRTIYWMMAQTGLRISEVLALKWNDITNGTINVQRSVWRGHFKSPKTEASRRIISISPRLYSHLSASGGSGDSLIFVNRGGRPWAADSLLVNRLHPLLDKLGIPRMGFHAFRHASASVLDRMNAPMKIRQQRLGHTNASLTLGIYTHSNDDDSRQVAAQFDDVFAPKETNGHD
jgi:integrase